MTDKKKPTPSGALAPKKKQPLFASEPDAVLPSTSTSSASSSPATSSTPVAPVAAGTPSTASEPNTPGEPLASSAPSASDPLGLTELFSGGGEPWLALLKPVLEKLVNAPKFVGPGRDKRIVPLRELTFQALKPNPPEKWKVVIFGQTPYPRVESATGISMFDNAFHSWQDPRFLQCASMRNMLKAALIWQHGASPELGAKEIPVLLAKHQVVSPEEWFQALLSQGVLLIDTSLTRSTDDSISVANHVEFWAPVAKAIVEAILSAKESAAPEHQGVIFAWWGAHARELRAEVEKLAAAHPTVPVRHVNHMHPAARTRGFCDGDHYKKLNAALAELGASEVGWLPTPGWQERYHTGAETAEHMGGFIKETMDLHKQFLERLQGAVHEKMEDLPHIDGVMTTPLLSFNDAAAWVTKLMPNLTRFVQSSLEFAKTLTTSSGSVLTDDEIAALYLYTTASPLYGHLNAELRNHDRSRIAPYFAYLRLFISALSKLDRHTQSLYRGVNADLRAQYKKGDTVTWWGVSSCTPKLSVAHGFLGSAGQRMLFEITPVEAFGIRRYSAFTGEDEYILLPGARLVVDHIEHGAGGLSTVKLRELSGARLLS